MTNTVSSLILSYMSTAGKAARGKSEFRVPTKSDWTSWGEEARRSKQAFAAIAAKRADEVRNDDAPLILEQEVIFWHRATGL